MSGTVHVVGAGLAGLACAVDLAKARRSVVVHEAAGHAGGRCRSFHDPVLDRVIDNGNHLVMRGNTALLRYLDTIGARGQLAGGEASFPFLDLADSSRWTVRPNSGPLPWWMLSRNRRVPGTRPADYLGGLRLARAREDETVADCLADRPQIFARLWEPLAVAALNTAAKEGSARLLWPVLAQTFLRGADYCRPYVARDGLSEAFVAPALAVLGAHGVEVRLNARLRAIGRDRDGGRATSLAFTQHEITLGEADAVVLAIPDAGAHQLLRDIVPDLPHRAIVNAHFRLESPIHLPESSPFMGLVGGSAQWLFVRNDVVSVTVSAADALAALANDEIARILWDDVATAVGLDRGWIPPVRIINERRATIAQTPSVAARRPGASTALENLYLAGDWTDTRIPATIEGAVLSGHTAAKMLLLSRKRV